MPSRYLPTQQSGSPEWVGAGEAFTFNALVFRSVRKASPPKQSLSGKKVKMKSIVLWSKYVQCQRSFIIHKTDTGLVFAFVERRIFVWQLFGFSFSRHYLIVLEFVLQESLKNANKIIVFTEGCLMSKPDCSQKCFSVPTHHPKTAAGAAKCADSLDVMLTTRIAAPVQQTNQCRPLMRTTRLLIRWSKPSACLWGQRWPTSSSCWASCSTAKRDATPRDCRRARTERSPRWSVSTVGWNVSGLWAATSQALEGLSNAEGCLLPSCGCAGYYIKLAIKK